MVGYSAEGHGRPREAVERLMGLAMIGSPQSGREGLGGA